MYKKIIYKQDVLNIAFENKNFNVNNILDTRIQSCTVKYIQPILGDDFYSWFADTFTDCNLTEATNPYAYELYIDYIRNALSYYVKYEMIIDNTYPITNAGVTIQPDSEGYHKAMFESVAAVKKQALTDAQGFIERAVSYIAANRTDLNTECEDAVDADGNTVILKESETADTQSGFILD